jgi:GT2 family glycosyltransferase
MADLSILIVNWNTKDLLLQCLRSITAELRTFRYEIVIVDNASVDGSVPAVREAFPLAHIIENECNLGFAAANNRGLKYCNGRYVLLVNSDIAVMEGCIAALWTYMEGHEEVGLVGPKVLNADLTTQDSCRAFPTIWNSLCRAFALDTVFPKSRIFGGQLMRYWTHDETRPVDILSGCFWMARQEALRIVGPLDERFFMYAEDKDWCKTFWERGWKVVYHPRAQAIHYSAASSSRDPVRFYVEMQRANLLYWKKHSGFLYQFIMWGIMVLSNSIRLLSSYMIAATPLSSRREAVERIRKSTAAIRWLLLRTTPGV